MANVYDAFRQRLSVLWGYLMPVMTATARPSTLTQISALHPLPKIISTVSDLSSIYLLLLCIRWELKKKTKSITPISSNVIFFSTGLLLSLLWKISSNSTEEFKGKIGRLIGKQELSAMCSLFFMLQPWIGLYKINFFYTLLFLPHD